MSANKGQMHSCLLPSARKGNLSGRSPNTVFLLLYEGKCLSGSPLTCGHVQFGSHGILTFKKKFVQLSSSKYERLCMKVWISLLNWKILAILGSRKTVTFSSRRQLFTHGLHSEIHHSPPPPHPCHSFVLSACLLESSICDI